jgi:tRNA (guanine-N7-)-methyltransferase
MDGAQDFEAISREETRPADWPGTRYEAKAIREGRRPLYWVFRRR